ncbi:MAG: hypothetical protein MMC23_006225 [Stictis urceolatum]|nr:hypothetical protein [Stictis urceolata]
MSRTRASNGQSLLFQLPNEILAQSLGALPTSSLLPLTVTCTRIHDLIIRILHQRLLLAASLRDHKLILECYHPAAQYTEPYLFCEYLGTPGLSSTNEGEGLVYESGNHGSRLGKLAGLYSQFRPLRTEEGRRIPRQHPAGGGMPVWTAPGHVPAEEKEANELVERRVSLDPEESFSQLRVQTNLVKPGPRAGLFENLVSVSDGLVRIWREWLKERAANGQNVASREGDGEDQSEGKAMRTLWMDHKTDIGLIVRIKEKKWRRAAPVLLHRDEEPAVTYSMEYEELLVRTTHLLLAVEESSKQDQNEERGKAMVFGAFVNRSSA